MTAVFLLGILVGLDNLEVGAGIGLVPMRTARRLGIALSCFVCETGMPLLGLALGHRLRGLAGAWAEGIGIAVLALCGLVILVLALREEGAESLAEGSFALVGLPLALSFDNLAAGVGLGSLGHPVVASALILGGVSGSLCALGLFAGGWLRRWIPKRAELLAGLYLLGLAAFRLVRDLG
jgi:manganese efflux pump family protein